MLRVVPMALLLCTVLGLTPASAGDSFKIASGTTEARTAFQPTIERIQLQAWPGDAVLVLRNGAQETGSGRVSSAVVRLNGVRIAGPSDFNQEVRELRIQTQGDLGLSLEFEVYGAPGSFLTYELHMLSPEEAEEISYAEFLAFDDAYGDGDTLEWLRVNGFVYQNSHVVYEGGVPNVVATFRLNNQTANYILTEKNLFGIGLRPFVAFASSGSLFLLKRNGGLEINRDMVTTVFTEADVNAFLTNFAQKNSDADLEHITSTEASNNEDFSTDVVADTTGFCIPPIYDSNPCKLATFTRIRECLRNAENAMRQSVDCLFCATHLLACAAFAAKDPSAGEACFAEALLRDYCITCGVEILAVAGCASDTIYCSRDCFGTSVCRDFLCRSTDFQRGSSCSYTGLRCADSSHEFSNTGVCEFSLDSKVACCPEEPVECGTCEYCEEPFGCRPAETGTPCETVAGRDGLCTSSGDCVDVVRTTEGIYRGSPTDPVYIGTIKQIGTTCGIDLPLDAEVTASFDDSGGVVVDGAFQVLTDDLVYHRMRAVTLDSPYVTMDPNSVCLPEYDVCGDACGEVPEIIPAGYWLKRPMPWPLVGTYDGGTFTAAATNLEEDLWCGTESGTEEQGCRMTASGYFVDDTVVSITIQWYLNYDDRRFMGDWYCDSRVTGIGCPKFKGSSSLLLYRSEDP